MAVYWGEKRYHSLDYHLKNTYGSKLYKLSLNGGMTCPNRDGTCGTRGCIFCSQGGSGDFAESPSETIREQIEHGKSKIAAKYGGGSYIAYFQAYTNTYAPVDYLRKIFTEAIMHPDIRILSVATRPDCLGEDILNLLHELNQIKPVWIELGLQTIHEDTASYIRRGYDLPVFEHALKRLRQLGIPVIVHTILGLPGEDIKRNLETMHYLNEHHIQGIKLQLLHVLKHTALADYYEKDSFPIFDRDSYCRLIRKCIELLPEEMVIHRITGDGPKNLLLAPLWSTDKKKVLNQIQKEFREHDSWQGKYYKK